MRARFLWQSAVSHLEGPSTEGRPRPVSAPWVLPRRASRCGPEPAPALLQASDDPRTQPHVTVLDRPCLLYPVCQVSNEVEEEVILRDADDLRTWPFWSTHLSLSNTEFSDFPTQGPPGGSFSIKTPTGNQKGRRGAAAHRPTLHQLRLLSVSRTQPT